MKLATKIHIPLLAMFFISTSAGLIIAQEGPSIEIGDRIRVSVPMQIDGEVVGIGDGEIIIHIPNHQDLTSIPIEAIKRLQVERAKTKSLIWGVIGGLTAGVGTWFLVDRSNAVRVESLVPEELDRRWYTSAFATVGGAFAGAIIGKRYKSFSWEVVPLANLKDRMAKLDGFGLTATWTLP